MSKFLRRRERMSAPAVLNSFQAASRLRLQVLEARVLLDAAAAETAAVAAEHAQAQAVPAPDASNAELMQALERTGAQAVAPVDAGTPQRDAPRAGDTSATNVYFVDRSVPDAGVLLVSLPRDAEVHFIEPGTDGVHAIVETLQGRTDISATDVDGDALHLVSINGVAITPGVAQSIDVPNGTVNIAADGTITFVPDADYNGPVDFDYVVGDANGAIDTGHVDISVKPVNDAPVAKDDNFSTEEDQPIELNLIGNDVDVDGDALHLVSINGVDITPGTAQVIDVPHGQILVSADGTVTLVPEADYNGTIDFDYVVADPTGASDMGHVRIAVPPVNDAPIVGNDSFTTPEDKPVTLDLLGNDRDVDGDALHLVSINGVDITPGVAQAIDVPHGTVNIAADGAITFVPDADYNGPVDFHYVVADPDGATGTGHVRVNVTPVNDAPVAGDDHLVTNEDALLTLNLLGKDVDADGDVLHLVSINGVAITPGIAQSIDVPNGTVNVAADGSITFVPDADYNGPVAFDYVVADPAGFTDTGHVSIDVVPVNDPPVAAPDSFATAEDQPLVLDLLGNDSDVEGDALHLVSINGVDITPGIAQQIDVPNGRVDIAADGTITFVPKADYNGPVDFDYVVADTSGATGTGHVRVNVTPVNDAPVAHDDGPIETQPGTSVSGNVLTGPGADFDADGDALGVTQFSVDTHTIEIDNNAGEMREIGRGTFHQAAGKDKATSDKAGAVKSASLGFSAQLAQASRPVAPPTVDADLLQALG